MKINYDVSSWGKYIPDINNVLKQMDSKHIMSIGITPYTRIVPAYFLENYSIYTIQKSWDAEIMKNFLNTYILEEVNPEVANKVKGTGYLTGNFIFQKFLKTFKETPKLLFYTLTEKIIDDLNKTNIPWIGNHPKTFSDVQYKGNFRSLVKEMGLESIEFKKFNREDFFNQTYSSLVDIFGDDFVIQRGDKETGGNEGTFFIKNNSDFIDAQEKLNSDDKFSEIVITPYIEGHSVSMLGCIMDEKILSGPIQLQFIDVPESLNDLSANGIFFGNDLVFSEWDNQIELDAQNAIEKVGEHMRNNGYKGIFGIDFLYDKKRNKIYPNECNPRFTGSLLLYSLALVDNGVPPLEFFHLAAHLDIRFECNCKMLQEDLKIKRNFSHISFSPKGISSMQSILPAGIYNYDEISKKITFKKKSILISDLNNKDDFMIVDTVPKIGGEVQQGVPRLFKFIFPYSIAKSSFSVDSRASFIIEKISKYLKFKSKTNENLHQKN